MINLGIVLAIHNYEQLGQLPGCWKDGEVISKALTMESRFTDVLVIRDDVSSSIIKARIIEFIDKYKDSEIGDFVFYFTGHGEYHGNDFYHLLPDYDPKKRNQTALQNSELDNLIRNLNPALCVKIVDACHSGISYIKDHRDFEEHLKSTQSGFKKLYFMYSSQSDQKSFQNKHLSFFTKAVAQSLVNATSLPIRYKDVIDYVSDAFTAKSLQTPFFVTQAGFTEPFCSPSESLRSEILELLKEDQPKRKKQVSASQDSFLSLVAKDAESYCSEAEAIENLNAFAKHVADLKLSSEIIPLYETRSSVETSNEIPEVVQIAEWFEKNKSDPEFFVRLQYETKRVTRRVRRNFLLSNLFATSDDDDNFVTKTENAQFAANFQPTVDLPYRFLCITADPKYANLRQAKCFIVPAVSRTHLRLFWTYASYDFATWNDRKLVEIRNWVTDEGPIKDASHFAEVLGGVSVGFSNFLFEPIKAKWRPVAAEISSGKN